MEDGLVTRFLIPVLVAVCSGIVVAVFGSWLSHRRLSDKSAFVQWRVAFDRRAFKGPYDWHSNKEDFQAAIEDTLASINTGKLFSRSGKLLKEGKSISELRNKHWRSLMEDVQSRLARIGDLNRRATLPDPSPTIAHEIDNERNEIIKRLNEIWTKLAIPVLALPTDWQRHSDIAAD